MSCNTWPRKYHYQLSVSGLRPDDVMWNSNQSDDSSDLGEADVGDEEYYNGDVINYNDVTEYDDVYDDNAIYDEYGEYMEEDKSSSFRGSRFGSYDPPEAASSPRAENGAAMSSYQFAALSGYASIILHFLQISLSSWSYCFVKSRMLQSN